MDSFLDQIQIDEDPFCDWDEETKHEVENYYDYDDLSAGIDFSNTNDF